MFTPVAYMSNEAEHNSVFTDELDIDGSESDDDDGEDRATSDGDPTLLRQFAGGMPPSSAVRALGKMVAKELETAGFDAAQRDVLDEFEGLLFTFLESLLQYAHHLAEHAKRARPTVKDLVTSCEHFGVGGTQELKKQCNRDSNEYEGQGSTRFRIRYEKPKKQIKEPLLLSGDEDIGIAPNVQTTRILSAHEEAHSAPYLPKLPAKHSYKQTPVFPLTPESSKPALSLAGSQQPPSAAALAHVSTIRARLNDSRLVANSLRSLIRRTSARGLKTEFSGDNGAFKSKGEDHADVVDFEGEWYGGTVGGRAGVGRSRTIRTIRILETPEDKEHELNGTKESAKVRGVWKRRRWVY